MGEKKNSTPGKWLFSTSIHGASVKNVVRNLQSFELG